MREFILLTILLVILVPASGCGTVSKVDSPGYAGRQMRPSFQQNGGNGSFDEMEAPKGLITLDDALTASLGRHPGLAAASHNIKAFDGVIQQAGTFSNPSLTGEIEEFGGSGAFKGTDVMASKIGISQEIPVAGQISRRVDVARAQKSIAEMEYAARALALKTEVKKRFLEVYTLQEQLKLEEENLTILGSLKDAAGKRVAAGDASPLEDVKVTVQLESADIALEKIKSELESAKYALASSWGEKTPGFTRVKSAYTPDIWIPEVTTLSEMLAANPSFRILEENVSLTSAALVLARSEKWKDIAVGGGIQRFNETDDHAYFLEVNIPIPLFNRNSGNIQEAVQKHNQAKKELEAGSIELMSRLHQSVKKLASTKKAFIAMQKTVLPAAEKAFDSVKRAYLVGEQDYLELVEAQRTYLMARREQLALFSELQTLIIELENFTGESIGK